MPRPVFAFLLFPFLFLSHVVSAQEPLTVDTSRRCIYSGRYFGADLYRYNPDSSVDQMVLAICRATHLPRNFALMNAYPVHTVAMVLQDSSYFLLYDRTYFYTHRSDSLLLYRLLAHEIGHFAYRHTLDGAFRLLEETEADGFAGRAMAQLRLNGAHSPDEVLAREELFSYSLPPGQYPDSAFAEARVRPGYRDEAFRAGWACGTALMKGLGFGFDKSRKDDYPIPRFRVKSVCGSQEKYVFPDSAFAGCRFMKDVDLELRKALAARGYSSRNYFAVQNGFVLATGIEQFLPGGVPAPEPVRWQDYPRKPELQGVFDFIQQYLSDLIFSHPARLRVIVFVVTDQPYLDCSTQCIDAEQTKAWLAMGMNGDWLPDEIGELPYSQPKFRVRALVYEFRRPEDTLRFREECDQRLSVSAHLEQSGLLRAIRQTRP